MIMLVTGGASCGKSAVAEHVCAHLGGQLVYLAAMRPFGEEGARRVEKHRAQRAGKGFETLEVYEGLQVAVDSDAVVSATVLLECLGNVVANAMFDDSARKLSQEHVARAVLEDLEKLSHRCGNLVIVGNEVGCDCMAYGAETADYIEALGFVSCAVASVSDIVVEVVAGIPTVLKADFLPQMCDSVVAELESLRKGGAL